MLYVKIAGLDETRDVTAVRDWGSDEVRELVVTPGSERHFLILELPGEVRIRAEVSLEDYERVAKTLEPVPTAWERL